MAVAIFEARNAGLAGIKSTGLARQQRMLLAEAIRVYDETHPGDDESHTAYLILAINAVRESDHFTPAIEREIRTRCAMIYNKRKEVESLRKR